MAFQIIDQLSEELDHQVQPVLRTDSGEYIIVTK